jgi:hypothetical protein
MIKIVDQDEAEQSDFVVCMLKGSSMSVEAEFPDNLEGECSLCHRAIVFRPHAPKKPPKICLECMVITVEDPVQATTNTMFNEARDYVNRSKN